jgi:threonine/homoserine/homoserine lactone efflux protein
MGNTLGFMDILIMLSGAYLIYAAVQMKRTGEISSALVGKGCDLKKAKDPKGYIEYMSPKSIILGIIVVLSGGADYLNEKYWHISHFNLVICVVILLVIIVYGKITMDAQKKYLSPK